MATNADQASEWISFLRGRAAYYSLKAKTRILEGLFRFQQILGRHPSLRCTFLISSALTGIFLLAGIGFIVKAALEAGRYDLQMVSRMEETTKICDRNGKLIYQFYQKQRTAVPLSKISKVMRDALVAIEDRNFYHHRGYDVGAVLRATFANLTSGRIIQGGSTLTQQLAKNAFLNSERSYKRKLQELWLASRIEHQYSKNQILELYANRVYFGSGFYGVEAAARGYFGKSAGDLNLQEAATLAGMVRAPKLYSPILNPSLVEKRRNLVLDAMLACDFITPDQASAAQQTPLMVRPRTDDEAADYAIEYVKEQLQAMFGYEKLFTGGLRVYTTMDSNVQRRAQVAVEDHLAKIEHQRGFGYESREKYLQRHRSSAEGDERPDYLQGALVCMDGHSGEIYALVGGRNFRESKFNRAVYAMRQPGSAFKPIVYAAALQTGMTPATVMQGNDLQFKTVEGGVYRPSNAHGRQYGAVTLRTALRNSINTVAVQLGQLLGPGTIIRTAHEFGIEGSLPAVMSLPLGAGEVTLLEMVRAYSAFPNEGRIVQPAIILRVEDKYGQVLYENHPATRYAVDPQTAFLMTTMLVDAVNRGTGSGIRAAGFRLPTGGKTGTTNDSKDAWFIGFTPDIVTGVWVGFDEPRQIMRNGYGATLALPIWAEFMKNSFVKASADEFSMPPGIEKVTICVKSGLLAIAACGANVYSDYFPMGSVPQFPCYLHDGMTDPSSTDSTVTSTDLATVPAGEPSETISNDRTARSTARGSVVFRN